MKEQFFHWIDDTSAEWTAMADEIYDHPEVGLQEHYACKLLTDSLKARGFSVETGVGGLETAFRAELVNGQGGPSIGLLCEYDALAGIGHGCGHHIQGPSCIAAAAAIQAVCKDLPYRLVVYGTPAEETIGGKILMKEKGCFQDIDVALMMHPAPTTTTDVKCMAMAALHVTFHGKSSHAAINPDRGRSALDAILLAAHGIECLREHVLEDTRMHYTILDAGGPCNIVPERAKMAMELRSYNTAYVKSVEARVRKILEGAALMTETTFEVEELPSFQGKIPVPSLNDLLMDNARLVNAPTIRPPREKTGSTDFGNVMYDVPGSCIRVAFVPEGTTAHSQAYVAAGKSEDAHKCCTVAAKVLAGTIYDLISDPKLLAKVRDEFSGNKEKMALEN